MSQRLIRIADLGLSVAGIAATAVLGAHLWRLAAPQKPPQSRTQASITRGEHLPGGLPFHLAQNEKALLLVLDSRCRFCRDSIGFYRSLVSQKHPNVSIAVVGRQTATVLTEFAAHNDLRADLVLNIPANYLTTKLTPLLILTDASGTVLDSWPGKLDERRQESVRAALRMEAVRSPSGFD